MPYRYNDFYDRSGRFHVMSDSSYLSPSGYGQETPGETAERERKRAALVKKHEIAFHQRKIDAIKRQGPAF